MRRQRGFTLAELVIVMVITGILGAVVVPRLNVDAFSARGTRDFVGAALRYAQKSAIAMRRNVCVSISAYSLDINYASASGITQACDRPFANPGNDLPYTDSSNKLQAKVSTPASLVFDAQGRPLTAAPSPRPRTTALTIRVTGYATPIIIEPQTGTIH